MKPIVLAVGFALLATCSQCLFAQESPRPRNVDFCKLVQQPEQFSGTLVAVRARLTSLKRGEWGIIENCWPPVLLVFPKDVTPAPSFELEESSDLQVLLSARNEHVSLQATFVGRFDWKDSKSSAEAKARSNKPFGKSRSAMRLVLKQVTDAKKVPLPYK
jgi:hypothetical protein